MAHTCPTCSEPCYCMGDYEEELAGQPAYCKHCDDEPPGNILYLNDVEIPGNFIDEFEYKPD